MIHCADALTNEFKTLLDQWIFGLHKMMNNNEKVMEELMHSAQAATGMGDMLGQSSEMDIVSLSLLLLRMVRSFMNSVSCSIDVSTTRSACEVWTALAPEVVRTQ